jgi:hypothetical protein
VYYLIPHLFFSFFFFFCHGIFCLLNYGFWLPLWLWYHQDSLSQLSIVCPSNRLLTWYFVSKNVCLFFCLFGFFFALFVCFVCLLVCFCLGFLLFFCLFSFVLILFVLYLVFVCFLLFFVCFICLFVCFLFCQ